MHTFIKWAIQSGWQVTLSEKEQKLPEQIAERYKDIPPEYRDFMTQLVLLANKEDTVWFLSTDDFNIEAADLAWPANSFETMSLEAANGDQVLVRQIVDFWDAHIPIVFSMSNGYEYYAIRINDGVIVSGREPEFEDVSIIAPSFQTFLSAIEAGNIVL